MELQSKRCRSSFFRTSRGTGRATRNIRYILVVEYNLTCCTRHGRMPDLAAHSSVQRMANTEINCRLCAAGQI